MVGRDIELERMGSRDGNVREESMIERMMRRWKEYFDELMNEFNDKERRTVN